MKKRKSIYAQALELWGIKAQKNQLIEECLELVLATRKTIKHDRTYSPNFIEELCDVTIMINQMKTLIPLETFNTTFNKKIHKLKKIIKMEKQNENFHE